LGLLRGLWRTTVMGFSCCTFFLRMRKPPSTQSGPSAIRKDRYERAIEWLKQVAAFKITVDGAPGLPDEERKQDSPWMFSSNPKRTTHL
jgi:phage gp36-like protein